MHQGGGRSPAGSEWAISGLFQNRGPDRLGQVRSGLGAEHRSRCGPRRAENGRAGLTNRRTPAERRAAAQPVTEALEGKGREPEKLA